MSARLSNLWNALVLMFFLLGISATATAQEESSAFQQANRLFEQEKFAEAAAGYERIVKMGKVSPDLLFNLGTAYLKDDQIGKAIATLIAAEKLAPRDENIQRNLQFARVKAGTGEMSIALWRRLFRLLKLNEWTLLAMLPFWSMIGLGIALQLQPQWRASLQQWLMLSRGLTLMFVLLVLIAATDRLGSRLGVVSGKGVVARFGPVSESQEAFALPDGTETTIIDETPGWFSLRDAMGRQGWVKAEQIALPQVH